MQWPLLMPVESRDLAATHGDSFKRVVTMTTDPALEQGGDEILRPRLL